MVTKSLKIIIDKIKTELLVILLIMTLILGSTLIRATYFWSEEWLERFRATPQATEIFKAPEKIPKNKQAPKRTQKSKKS